MMFSPASAHIAPFCPNNGADAARQYACKYAGKPEKTVDGFNYATSHGPVHTHTPPIMSATRARHAILRRGPRTTSEKGIARMRVSPRGIAKLAPSPGGIIWRAIAAVSRNFSNAELWGCA